MSARFANLGELIKADIGDMITPLSHSNEVKLNKLKNLQTFTENQKMADETQPTDFKELSKETNAKMFQQIGSPGALPKRAMSIAYMNKAVKNKQRESLCESRSGSYKKNNLDSEDFDISTDTESLSSTFLNERDESFPGYLPKSQLSSTKVPSGVNISFLHSLGIPERASVDLSMPLDPTYVFTPEDRLNSSRSNTSGSMLSVTEIMDIEKKGENLFNSSVRKSNPNGSISPGVDPSIRFSTADAKRLSIMNMNNSYDNVKNSSATVTQEQLPPANSFKNPFFTKSTESSYHIDEIEPDTIRRRMSLQIKSLSESPELFDDQWDSSSLFDKKRSSSSSGRRRRSSLLASGDVLSMKGGVFKRTPSNSKDEQPYLDVGFNLNPNYDEDVFEAKSDFEDSKIVEFSRGNLENSTLETIPQFLSPSTEIDPLDTNIRESSKNNKSRKSRNNLTLDDKFVSDMRLKTYKSKDDDNIPIRKRVKSIAENTIDQFKRNSIIKSNPSAYSSSPSLITNEGSKPVGNDSFNFHFIKNLGSKNSKIDLSNANDENIDSINSSDTKKQ